VERICVDVVVNVRWGEPVVVTVVLMVPVITGLSVVGASVVAAAVETELVVKLVVTELVWLVKDVLVVERVEVVVGVMLLVDAEVEEPVVAVEEVVVVVLGFRSANRMLYGPVLPVS